MDEDRGTQIERDTDRESTDTDGKTQGDTDTQRQTQQIR